MWKSQAPSNIALIKYMGKINAAKADGNRPTNPSLSYTLSHFITEVQIEKASQDDWEPLEKKGFYVRLSSHGRERFLQFFSELKQKFQIKGHYRVLSANNFPSDCGLASSASSFAALTKAAYALAQEHGSVKKMTARDLSKMARTGSGSSCRSFFAPWALWQDEGAEPLELPYQDLIHQVAVIEESEKLVSSSEAHRRVNSSLLFEGRPARAEVRLKELVQALQTQDWKAAFELTWAEFWDMHALFESSRPSFGYMAAGSVEVLNMARQLWQSEGEGPLVTMDAGPNVHFLYRQDQKELANRFREQIEETDSSTRVIGNDTETV
jgi:diphosphomevalonate decarboxylase